MPSPGVPVSFSSVAVGAAGMSVSTVYGRVSSTGALALPAASVKMAVALTEVLAATTLPGTSAVQVPSPLSVAG
ncbi:hypothetical protein D3C87_1885960 [compost metagenome]